MKTKVNVLSLVASFALAVVGGTVNLDSSVECLTQRRREAESAENARNLANTMSMHQIYLKQNIT